MLRPLMNTFIKILITNYVDVMKYFNGFSFDALLNNILIHTFEI